MSIQVPTYFRKCCSQKKNLEILFTLENEAFSYHCKVCGNSFWHDSLAEPVKKHNAYIRELRREGSP